MNTTTLLSKLKFCFAIPLLLLGSCGESTKSIAPVDLVNQNMGNISHLLVPTFPTVHLPNSLLRLYPERDDYTTDQISGLPVMVTSHRGKSAFNISPYQGDKNAIKPVVDFSYDHEQFKPYSYSVYLDDFDIEANCAVSHQSAIYNIQFNKSQNSYLIFNSKNGEMSVDGNVISGYQDIANDTKVYIYAVADKEGVKSSQVDSEKGSGDAVFIEYGENVGSVKIRYGVSLISVEQAAKNLEREIPYFDIEKVALQGEKIWNDALSKIEITGGTDDDQRVFYTSLYRCYERPVCVSEDGKYYSPFDKTVHNDGGVPFYTDDWIWDTYRATHPLRAIINPKMEGDIINSFVLMAEQMGTNWMPTFPEVTGDSRRMNSNHGVATVIDGWKKRVRGFDLKKAYAACRGAIMEKTLIPWSGEKGGWIDQFYHTNGYIPALKRGEEEFVKEVGPFEKRQPVAVTLGTSYDEWCLSVIAEELGYDSDADYFRGKALNYRNIFNSETSFFHPKDSDGEFIEPFDYSFSGGMGAREYYGENNGWVYRWDVPHNVADLIDLMGGSENFNNNLDAMFRAKLDRWKFQFYAKLPDHTGNVGQFSMANEPSLHIPYLYNYSGKPWKSQKRIHSLIHQWFRNDLMGVPGDEDGGGMSAFVVFSMAGFYPVTPGMPIYVVGTPMFETIKIALQNGKFVKIKATDLSTENKYIQSMTIDGKEWNKPWFSHSDIADGADIGFVMGRYPNKEWGSAKESMPPSFKYFDVR